MGGCLLGDNLSWASTMLAYTTLPPDPDIVGDAWQAMWLQRLEGLTPWLIHWLTHQTRDDYWKHGSVCEDFSQVQTPVMAVSGWSDAYTNSVFRLLEKLPAGVPRCGLVGPWSHKYPHIGKPGPAIGFLQESLRWWDWHVKGKQSGIDSEPLLRAYLQDPMPPNAGYDFRPGRWVGETHWPSQNIDHRAFALTAGRDGLAMQADGSPKEIADDDSEPFTICSPVSIGYFGGKWCSEAAPPDLPDDQREDDGGALTFDSPPLDQPLEILGAPEITLQIAADRPVAMVAVRLSEVLPDGRVSRLAYGLKNLTHRAGHETPELIEPGKFYSIRMKLNDVGHRFLPKHRIRVSISSSYWPLAWLPPELTTLTIQTKTSQLTLPIRNASTSEPEVRFPPPESAIATKPRLIEPTEHSWKVIRDLGTGRSELQVRKGRGTQIWEEIDWQRSTVGFENYRVHHADILSAQGEVRWTHGFARGDWNVRCETRTILSSDADNFRIRCDVDAFIGDQRIFCRSWDKSIPREFV